MALQFSCPYCTAAVRVPDSAAGKLGECPRCATKIRIPALPKGPASNPPSAAPLPPVAPAPLPPAPAEEVPAIVDWSAALAARPAPPPAPVANPDAPFDFDSFDFSSAPSASAAAAPSRAAVHSQSGSGMMTWIVLLLVGGIAGGVFAYMRFRDRPVYVGEAVGERIPAGKTVAVVVPWDTIGVDLQTRQAVIEYFTRRPGKMINPLVEMQIGTLPTGLEVRFNPGRDAELIRVDPLQIKDLQKLVLEKGKAWDATREAELKAGAIRLCQAAAAAHLNDTAVAGLTEYGRPVGINSMVHGLGYECEAIYDQTRYPCVMEDGDGSLYFLVPDKIRVFQVQQRSDQGHPPVLPAEFSLRVTVPPYPIEAPHVEPEPGEVPDPATDRKPQVAPTKRPPQADAKAMDKP